MAARRKFWGWGLESEGASAQKIAQLEGAYAKQFGVTDAACGWCRQ